MPMSAIERAEKVLLNMTDSLRSIQHGAYSQQERTAQKIHRGFLDQRYPFWIKSGIEALSLVGLAAIHTNNLNNVPFVDPALPNQEKQKVLSEYLKRAADYSSALIVEPIQLSRRGITENFSNTLREIESLNSGLQSVIQTHEAALQRLQNIESNTRSTG